MANYVDQWKKEKSDVEEKLLHIKKGNASYSIGPDGVRRDTTEQERLALEAKQQELSQKIIDAEAKGD